MRSRVIVADWLAQHDLGHWMGRPDRRPVDLRVGVRGGGDRDLVRDAEETAMSDLRWKIHSMRMRHGRHMAQALSNVEKAAFHVREANRYGKGFSADYAATAKRHALSGWGWMEHAISQVTECGCPRLLWPEKVQKALKEHTDES